MDLKASDSTGPFYIVTKNDEAAFRSANTDLTNYIGAKIIVIDSSGNEAIGWIKEADDAEALGSELISNGDFTTDLTGWTETMFGDASASVVSGEAEVDSGTTGVNSYIYQDGSGATGRLYKYTLGNLEVTGGTGTAWFRGDDSIGPTQTFAEQSGVGSQSNLTGYRCLEWTNARVLLQAGTANGTVAVFDDVSVKQVTALGTDAVHIVSTQGGSTYRWESLDSGFDPNDISEVKVYVDTVKWFNNPEPSNEVNDSTGPFYISIADGYAAIRSANTDLTSYIGQKVIVEDSSGNQVTGWVKEADVAESLGSTVGLTSNCTDPDDDQDNTTGWNASGSALLSSESGGNTGNCLKILENGANNPRTYDDWTITSGRLYKFEWWHKDIDSTAVDPYVYVYGYDGSFEYRYGPVTPSAEASWTQVTAYVSFKDDDTSSRIGLQHTASSGDGTAGYYDDVTLKPVDNLGTDAVLIVSEQFGSTQNWSTKDDDFDPNDISSVKVLYQSTNPIHIVDAYDNYPYSISRRQNTGAFPFVVSLADGYAACWHYTTDLSPYVDRLLEVIDSSGCKAFGWIKEGDSAESLGSEIIDNGDMELDSGWVDSGIGGNDYHERSSEQALSGTYSRKIYTEDQYTGFAQTMYGELTVGRVYKISFWGYPTVDNKLRMYSFDGTTTIFNTTWTSTFLIQNNQWNYVEIYYTSTGTGGNVHFSSNNSTGSPLTLYFDDASMKPVDSLGENAVKVVSTRGGSTYNWAWKDDDFDPNAIVELKVHKVGSVRYWNEGNVKWWGNTYVNTMEVDAKIQASLATDSDWLIKTTSSLDSDWLILTSAAIDSDWKIFNAATADFDWLIKTSDSIDSDWKVFNALSVDSDWLIKDAKSVDSDWKIFNTSELDIDWLIRAPDLTVDFDWLIKTSQRILVRYHIVTDPADPKSIHVVFTTPMTHLAQTIDFSQLARNILFNYSAKRRKYPTVGANEADTSYQAKTEGFSHTARAIQFTFDALDKPNTR